MTVTITGSSTLSPELVLGWESTRTARNVVHEVIDRADPVVTLRPAGLRTGTLSLFCLTLADALAMETLHTEAGVLHIEDDELPALAMDYVPAGSIGVTLDEETRARWVVAVDYQEILP